VDKSSVKVNIYGSEYVIKGDDNADHIRAIADYVDQKMKEINKSGAIKSPLKVAILAALNITDEFFKTSADQTKTIETMENKAQKMLDMLTQAPLPETLDLTPEANEQSAAEEINLFSQK